MRMGQGVEWALHCCLNLAWVDAPVPGQRLAAYYDLPPAYLNKQLQALVRAGICESVPGARGGFRLAGAAAEISLLDVVVALEGREGAFRCTSILSASPGGDPGRDYSGSCAISVSMRRAELAWRRELAGRSLADVGTDVLRYSPDAMDRVRAAFT
ncbi:RrF2 family transcriptional regulator [Pseudonocardia sp. HH130630-07]|uniref:RrF2 family transcriptional regulator n=1 Tax=Pseudonocardia sp. HH130630-07 TaxID=1690815 RepID=UPI000814FC34|nr:Rrf2 family transcriptional regulator [Pseudonocardia sp. HH130630-07]ANY06995.1 Rrf2 family transcriptional regulator [Pseudonocardia sp. HH130630-07]